MEVICCNTNDKEYQILFNDLLKDIFLDFQFWFDLEMWDDQYESYSVMENGIIVSNISIYKTKIIYMDNEYDALSIGAVATKKEYRNKGYSRRLMTYIINKYIGIPMYLSANEGVVDFYPRFGFRRIYEKLPVAVVSINNEIHANKLNYNNPRVYDYIINRNSFSQSLDCLNGMSINIFHIHEGYLHNHIYELEAINTMVIATQEDNVLKLKAVFSKELISFATLMSHLPFAGIEKIEFAFMPYWEDCKYLMIDYEHDPIFVKNISCELADFKFPELSIT